MGLIGHACCIKRLEIKKIVMVPVMVSFHFKALSIKTLHVVVKKYIIQILMTTKMSRSCVMLVRNNNVYQNKLGLHLLSHDALNYIMLYIII